MNRAAIEELFNFTEHSWRVHEETIRPHGDEFLVRPVPGSGWPALRDALVHINWAYVRWLADPDGTTDAEPEAVTTWDELDANRGRVRGLLRAYLDSRDDQELQRPREMNINGRPLVYSPADILVHVLLHERQHHGDVSTLLYQLGVDPPIVEYRFSLPERQA